VVEGDEREGVVPTVKLPVGGRVVLVQSMLLPWEAFEHLAEKGAIEARFALKAQADGCCKPDGGSCCPNRQFV
jgi:hypothetical protein